MPSPLLSVDANARHTGSKLVNSSKVPSPPTAQRTSSTGRRSPFSVSAAGSPRYTAMSPPPSNGVSPAVTSKIPRKSQMPTNVPIPKSNRNDSRPGPQRSSLPMSRGAHKSLAAPTPAYVGTKKLTPPSIRNKPLPSPPIAQVINPNSPPNAQRTLVDADSGSPSEEQWPILRPENVLPPKKPMSPANETDVQQQRSVSEGAAPRQIANPFFVNKELARTVVTDAVNEPKQISTPARKASSHYQKFTQMTEPRALSSKDPYANTFHAISTESESAVQSPLAHKKSALGIIPVPPRISSNRSSLPLASKPKPDSPTLPPSPQLRPVKPGSTRWPVLEEKETESCVVNNATLAPEKSIKVASTGPQSSTAQADTHPLSHSTGTDHTAQSHHDSIKTDSSWSMAAGSSLNNIPQHDYESSTRVKRLSWRSSVSGSGPVLTIFGDADALLLSGSDSMPDVPAMPDTVPVKAPQERSLSALAGRISKQTMSRISVGLASGSSTPTLTENGTRATTPKINPIRSMQPARNVSSEMASRVLSSSASPTSLELKQPSKISLKPSAIFRAASDASQKTIAPTLKPAVSSLPSPPESFSPSMSTITENDNFRQANVPLKADQVLNINQEAPPPLAARKRLPTIWKSPSLSSLKSKKANLDHSKTSLSINSAGRLSSRNMSPDSSTSRVGSPMLSRTAQSRNAIRLSGASMLRTVENATPISGYTPSERGTPLSRQNKLQRSTPVSSPSPFDNESTKNLDVKNNSQAKEATAQKMKMKRSFRSIFQKRDAKRTEKQPMALEPKQQFVTGTRSSLAKRIRNSTTLSTKVHLPSMSESKPEPERQNMLETETTAIEARVLGFPAEDADRQATLSSLEAASSSPASEISPAPRYDTATVVNNIISRVTSMPQDSPDRLRGLEIAEAVLHSLECYREAKVSAEKAKKHARDAELNAERAGMELVHLQKLCRAIFDGETLQAMMEHVNCGARVEDPKPPAPET